MPISLTIDLRTPNGGFFGTDDGGVPGGALVTLKYDRDVRDADGTVPAPAQGSVVVSGATDPVVSVPFANDDAAVSDDSQGFAIIIGARWRQGTQVVSWSKTVAIDSSYGSAVSLSDLADAQPVPPQQMTVSGVLAVANQAVSDAQAAETSAASSADSAAASAALVGAPAGSAIDAHLGGDSTNLVTDVANINTTALFKNTDASVRTLSLYSSLSNTVQLALAQGLNGARWSMQSSTNATGTAGMELQLIPDANASTDGSTTEILLFHKTGANYMRTVWHAQANQAFFGCSSGGTSAVMPMVFYMGEYSPQGLSGVRSMVMGADGTVSINGGKATVNTGLIPAGATITAVAGDGSSATISAGPAVTSEWAAGGGYITQVLVNGTVALPNVTITAGSTQVTATAGTFTPGMVGQTILDQRIFANLYARIVDALDSGQTRLIVDTCTTTPSKTSSTDKAIIQFNRGGVSKWLVGNNVGNANVDSWDISTAGGVIPFKAYANGSVQFGSNNTSLMPSGAPGVIGIVNAGAVPTGNATNGGTLYASGGALYWRGSSGTVTKIAPA